MPSSVRILCWNLGHATREVAIPSRFYDAVSALTPNVLILNEFKDGPTREMLRSKLIQLGLRHWLVSEDRSGHNQVLIASSSPIESGDLRCAEVPDSHALTNFLHVILLAEELEVVGFRAPAYKSTALRQAYWRELVGIMRRTSNRDVVFAGDFNADPCQRGSDACHGMSKLVAQGWEVTSPTGQWSFCKGSRIDHAAVSPGVKLSSSEYVAKIGEVVLSDKLPGQRISDHAALMLKVEKAESRRKPARNEMKFQKHTSDKLVRFFYERPFQGQSPEKASIIFLSSDANYSSEISSVPFFKYILEYQEDGVAFWKKYRHHHPFMLSCYPFSKKKAGVPFHKTFSKLGLGTQHAAHISFLELLNVPTIGNKGNNRDEFFSLLSLAHLKYIESLILGGGHRLFFVSRGVVENIEEINKRFSVFGCLNGLSENQVLFLQNGNKIKQIYHFSSSQIHRQLPEIRSEIDSWLT